MYAISNMPTKLAASMPHEISPAPAEGTTGAVPAATSVLPTDAPHDEQKAAPGFIDFPHLEQNIVVAPNDLSSAAAVGGRLRRNVRCTMPLYKKLATIIFNGCSGYLLSVVAEINIYILHPQVNKIFGRFTLAGGVI